MSYLRYQHYKDSGIEWLGEMPSHWVATPIKRLGRLKGGSGFPHDEQGNEGEELQFHKVNALGKADSDGLLIDGDNTVSIETAKRLNAHIFPEKSLVFAKVGAALYLARICQLANPSCIDNNMMGLIVNKKKFDPSFVKFAMSLVNFELIANPGAVPSLNEGQIGNFKLGIPSLLEQSLIAAFLGREIAKIDELAKAFNGLIDLLKEKRQAVISHAVTKGLDPSVPMKDSGIDWIGSIPHHWEMKRLKYLGKAITGLTYSPTDIVDEENGILVLRSSNVQKGQITLNDNVFVSAKIPENLVTRIGDILICSRNGSRALIGKNATIDSKSENLTFGAFMTIFRSEDSAYMSWILNSSLFEFQSGAFMTSTINQLTLGVLNNFEIPLPPSDERRLISEFLEIERSKFNELIEEAFSAIETLKERRTALISAAVTGKIDVRGLIHAVEKQKSLETA